MAGGLRVQSTPRAVALTDTAGELHGIWLLRPDPEEGSPGSLVPAVTNPRRGRPYVEPPGITLLSGHTGALLAFASAETAAAGRSPPALSWRIPAEPVPDWRIDRGRLHLRWPRTDWEVVFVLADASGAPAEATVWSVARQRDGLRVSVGTTEPPHRRSDEVGETVLGLVGGRPGRELAGALEALRHRRAHEERTRGDLRSLRDDWLSIEIDPDRNPTAPKEGSGPDDRGLTGARVEAWKEALVGCFLEESGAAWIVAGVEHDTAQPGEALLARPRRAGTAETAWIGLGAVAIGRFDLARRALTTLLREETEAGSGEAASLSLLLTAWTGLWSGEPERTPELERWVRRALRTPPPNAARPGLRSLALRELADTLEPLGEPRTVAELRMLAGEDSGANTRASLAFDIRPSGPGAARAAHGLASLVFGRLGARADASFGRLLLSPVLPRTWRSLSVERLRVGDSSLAIHYRRSGARHSLLFRPTGGRVPLNLVVEPRLALPGIRRVLLDESEIEVERFGWEGGLGFRLQLPLDRDRRLTVDEEDGRDP